MESILTSIKKLIGITEECTDFDIDIIMHINSVLSILCQIGVGPSEGFSIEDSSATWDEFIESNSKLEMVKSYVYLKVRMMFDPPINGAVMEAMKRNIDELEWRMNISVDPGASSKLS